MEDHLNEFEVEIDDEEPPFLSILGLVLIAASLLWQIAILFKVKIPFL